MLYTVEFVQFRGDEDPPLPGPYAREIRRIVEALSCYFAAHPLDLHCVRWRERACAFGDAMAKALVAITAEDPQVLGGWRVRPEPIDSTANPKPKPGEPLWWPKDGASFALVRSAPKPGECLGELFLSIVRVREHGEDERTVCVDVKNDSGVAAHRVTVHIPERRTVLVGVALAGQGGRELERVAGPLTAIFTTALDAPLAPGAKLELKLRFIGDPPYLKAVTWSGSADPSSCATQHPRAAYVERTFAEELEDRARCVATLEGPDRAFGAFFLHLDRETMPDERSGYAALQLAGYLMLRVMIRAEEASHGDTPTFHTHELTSWRPVATQIGDQLRWIYLAHFPELATCDTARFGAAFERFATGALLAFDTHGVPNGVSYFCFGELALLMLELDHHAEFWRPLVPIFARTSELYAESYHRRDGARSLTSYAVQFGLAGAREQDPCQLERNRKAWEAVVDPTYSFGRIVHAALADEVQKGPLAPFALRDAGDTARDPKHGCKSAPGEHDRNWRGRIPAAFPI